MSTRLSQLFVRTLREDPVDAEVASHRLLVRAGYIRRQAPGVFAWLPLGLKVRRKIEQIVREEMDAAGAQEVLFPALLPREPYELTGRWEEYGDNIFRLKDRKGADLVLGMEVQDFASLISQRDRDGKLQSKLAPGGTRISMTSQDLFMKSNYQLQQRMPDVELAVAADSEATLPLLIEEGLEQIG